MWDTYTNKDREDEKVDGCILAIIKLTFLSAKQQRKAKRRKKEKGRVRSKNQTLNQSQNQDKS